MVLNMSLGSPSPEKPLTKQAQNENQATIWKEM